jgi:hypothetical protein
LADFFVPSLSHKEADRESNHIFARGGFLPEVVFPFDWVLIPVRIWQ